MRVRIEGLEHIPDDDLQQDIGQGFLLVLYSRNVKVDGVEVIFEND